MNNTEEFNTKILNGFDGYYKYTRVADITKIISNMFGINVKLAYLILDDSDNKESLSTIPISLSPDYLDEGGIYIEFDKSHKVLFEPSEWLMTQRIKEYE